MSIILSLLLLYILVSLFFFLFPNLLHRRKSSPLLRYLTRHPGRVSVFSHRGGSLEHFENSLSAFKNSIKSKAECLELDVWKSKDGHLVVFHDKTLERVTGQKQGVFDLDFSEISHYLSELSYLTSVLRRLNDSKEKPCLLEDLFKEAKASNCVMSIDVKTRKLEDVVEVVELARRHGLFERIIVGCMGHVSAAQIKAVYPSVNCFFNFQEVLALIGAFFLGFLPFVRLVPDSLQMPFAFQIIKKDFGLHPLVKLVYYFKYIWPVFRLLNWHLRRRGVPVNYFIANEEEDFELSLKCGVDSIMTDRPSFLKEYLEKRGLFAGADEAFEEKGK